MPKNCFTPAMGAIGILSSIILSAVLLLSAATSKLEPPAQQPPNPSTVPTVSIPSGDKPAQTAWGDLHDGTYANPVMPGDFSDLDVIRLGKNFYAISSTLQYSPGIALLESPDLVNWQLVGHAVADLTRLSPELNWDKMNRSGRGIWAGSLRHHAGRFWIYFGTPDEGIFATSAPAIPGPWSPPVLVLPQKGWDDPCPFWDHDGQGYLVTTHFEKEESNGKTYDIHLFQLSADGRHVVKKFDRLLYQSPGSEANKLYKINGFYFHYFSEVAAEGRVIMMRRARSLAGPWETRQLNHVNPAVDKEPNQGGLIQLPTGEWFFLSHQGTGDWEGRAGVLLPVTWIAGWPIIGKPGPDGIGNMVWRAPKPIQGFSQSGLVASDDFNQPTLKPHWEWNYQPRQDRWSLAERPGFLRMHSFPPLRPADFHAVGNVLTQRSMRTSSNEVTVKLDLQGMVDGQVAGLAHFANTFTALEIVQQGMTRTLVINNNGRMESGPAIDRINIWLRSTWDFDGKNRFSYSLDGTNFKSFGDPSQLSWGNYRGDRIGIFTVNEQAEAGYLDIDSFTYQIASARPRQPHAAQRLTP